MNATIKRRLAKEVDGSIPLGKRIDLKRLRAALELPLVMNTYFMAKDSDDAQYFNVSPVAFKECGTVGCLAGNVILNELPVSKQTLNARLGVDLAPAESASRILGMTEEETDAMFHHNWPDSTVFKRGTKAYGKEVKRLVAAHLLTLGVTL